MDRIVVESVKDSPSNSESIPNPPRLNVESPPTSCFTEDRNGIITRNFFATPEELADHLNHPIPRQKGRKLYVLEGLPIEYVQVFGVHFSVDVDIFDSHAMRKSGQLSKLKFPAKPGNGSKVRAFALDHPEITSNIVPRPEETKSGVIGDFMLPCETIELPQITSGNGLSVRLCHMTLVSFPIEDGGETLLLLLENPSWTRRGEQFQTASYDSILARAIKSLPDEKQQWKPSQKNDPALTLTDQIFDAIASPGGMLFWDDLTEVVTDIVIRQWRFTLGEVIEQACASRLVSYHEIHQICDLLESNIWTLERAETIWNPRYDGRMEGFKGLLKKAKRYTELFVWGQMLDEGLKTKTKVTNEDDDDEDNDTSSVASLKSGVHIRGGEVVDLETRQSINRVTYLGGVLLPFSIIAAIFSMGGNFQPGGDQFFIFWVIAIPVCLLTTALIYADSIRRMTLEQFAQQYGPAAVNEEVHDMVASSISDCEIISYKTGIRERLASHIAGLWNRNKRHVTSSSSSGYSDNDSDDDSSSTSSTRLPPGVSVDDDLLVRKKKKKESSSWSWRFWRRKPLGQNLDPENVPPSTTHSTHDVPPPPAPAPAPPPGPISSPPELTPVDRIPVGSSPESPRSNYPPIAGPAPPKAPSTSPPSSIPAPNTPDLSSDDGSPQHSNPAIPSINPSIPDPAEIPLPPSPDSTSDEWRERNSSEMIHHERSPSPPDPPNSDYATDRECHSLERRMRENDEWELNRRGRRHHVGTGDDHDEQIIEREIIYDHRRRSERQASSESRKRLVLEETTRRFVEEQKRKRASEGSPKYDDIIPEDRGRRRERSRAPSGRRGTYYSNSRRPDSDLGSIKVSLPPSPEELAEEERMAMKLEEEKIKRLKEEEQHKKMAEAGEEYAKKRAEEKYAKKRAEEESKKMKVEAEKEAAARRASKGKDRAYSPVASDSKRVKPAIKFKDAVGRKFSFPFHLVSTWAGMEELIKQAFLHVDVLGPHVNEGHYDLIGPEGEIILPQVWESVIEPGWLITMHMWPLPENKPIWRAPAPGWAPPPPERPQPTWGRPPPPPRHPRPGFVVVKPGGFIGRPGSKMTKSSPANFAVLNWMAGKAPASKPRKKKGHSPIRPGPPPPPPPGRRESDEVIVIEDPQRSIHRRQTGISDRHRHGTSGGAMIAGVANPNEELGWVRALGTIVGVKPGMQVKKRSGGSSSGSSLMDH
ncbi:hypothetical protein NHQ30_011685 [Ciborinia camelliae]|nr:hypothetical protein NHQ30_011685 [Ciborinia camelliae]